MKIFIDCEFNGFNGELISNATPDRLLEILQANLT